MKQHNRRFPLKTKKRKKTLAGLLILTLLWAAGCGANNALPSGVDAGAEDIVSEAAGIAASTAEPEVDAEKAEEITREMVASIWDMPGEKTLTVSQCWDFYYLEEAAEKFKELHPEVTVKVTKYANDYEAYMEQINSALMAGTADDLLDGFGLGYQNETAVKQLADFYPVMRKDPEFNDEDYYMNVFEALSYKGGLYTFPLCFSYELMGVNNRVSDALVRKYMEYASVSAFDLLEIYKGAPGGQDMYMHDSFDMLTALGQVMGSFIDTENKTCDFNNPRFINLITDAKAATEPDKMMGYTYMSNVYDPQKEAEQSAKYLFQNAGPSLYQYLLPFESELCFSNVVPVTNDQGEMLMSPLKNFCINGRSENKELAWEFIKFMMMPESNTNANGSAYIPDIPVYRPLFRFKIEKELPGWIGTFERDYGWIVTRDKDEVLEEVTAHLDTLNQWPMAVHTFLFYEIMAESIEQFNKGDITAEQCAAELQDKVSKALTEANE